MRVTGWLSVWTVGVLCAGVVGMLMVGGGLGTELRLTTWRYAWEKGEVSRGRVVYSIPDLIDLRHAWLQSK